MARFLIINTGGTIGMKPGENGLEPFAGQIEKALLNIEALQAWKNHQLIWNHWQPLLDSSDLSPSDWFKLVAQVKNQTNVDGVLIIHGTDTLAYTAAALSYLLSDTKIPVVITGSMLPVSADGTDAINNLNLALDALVSSKNEVIIAVGEQFLPGCRATKVSTQKHSAFEAPSWTPVLWQQAYEHQHCQFASQWVPVDIAVVTLFPGIPVQSLTAQITADVDAILINAFGNGNARSTDAFESFLALALEHRIPVFVRSQCLEGNVNFNIYAAGSLFTKHKAISCGTMTFEAAVTKLLLAKSMQDRETDIPRYFKQSISREWQS